MTAPQPDAEEVTDESSAADGNGTVDPTGAADAPDAPGAEPEAPDESCGQCGEYLDALTRLKAEFVNYRRRAAEQQAQAAERGAADLASRLLAVLDACEAGAAHHSEVVGPLHGALVDALTAEGLEVISPQNEPFDPAYHEAVAHESAEVPGEQIVIDVLRTGYAWGGRVLRPAVVGVRG